MITSVRASTTEQCPTCARNGSCVVENDPDRTAALDFASRNWTDGEGSPTRVLVCSDNPIMRRALHLLIATRPNYQVAVESAICPHALRQMPNLGVDVMLVDLDLDERSDRAIPSLQSVFDASPSFKMFREPKKELPVLVLTTEPEPEACRLAYEYGVRGMVLKTKTTEDLFAAIDRIGRGESWLEGSALAKLFGHTPKAKARSVEDQRIAQLTKREREIVGVVACGRTNRQIGQQLFISGATVRHHLCAIFEKLGVTTRGELIVYAYRHQLADRKFLENAEG
jgi:two-component system nitrate/nitrite response regulator NarL